MKRRQFLKLSALAGAGLWLGAPNAWGSASATADFSLPSLPFAYNALAPIIDAQTMEIHHSKHHQAYVDNLNKALKTADAKFQNKELTALMALIDGQAPAAIRNNGGGHYNHSLFWKLLQPAKADNQPKGDLKKAIESQFGSFDQFKAQFQDAAMKVFGSGWAWLIKTKEGKLQIGTTANQDNPLMPITTLQGIPVLALDVWEHAYYLQYQNKRKDYVQNFWQIVNWSQAEANFKL